MSDGSTSANLVEMVDALLAQDSRMGHLSLEIRAQFITSRIPEKTLLQTGSSLEGSCFCRWFQDTGEAREIEIDMMYQLFFKECDVQRLEPVDGKLCHVKVPWRLAIENSVHENLDERLIEWHSCLTQGDCPEYLSPLQTREMSRDWLKFSDKDKTGEFIIAQVFGIGIGEASHSDNDEVTGASHQLTYTVQSSQGDLLRLSLDNVPSIRLPYWPEPASEWGSRKGRKWPHPDVVKRMQKMGCHLVPKSSIDGDVHTEWRYSFSNAEIMLASCRTQQQKRVYFLAKAIFYRYLKPIRPPAGATAQSNDERKGLFSYLLKTTMMWLMEEHPPEEVMWQDLITAVKMVLAKLASYLSAKPHRYLPNYFIPEVNLLEELDEEVCQLAVAELGKMEENIEAYLPKDMANILQMIIEMIEKVESLKEVAHRMLTFNDLKNSFKKTRHLVERHLEDEDLD